MLAEHLVLHAEKCLKIPTRYIWGGIGEFLTQELVDRKAKLYPEVYMKEYIERLRPYLDKGIRGFDCSGLINHFRMGGLEHWKMTEELDQNSSMLYKLAKEKGNIENLPEFRGICLYMKGHVGIYAGNGRVIEATSNEKFGNGVVETQLKDREWTHWFYCPLIEY